jgi:hypothetical protein
MKIPFLRREKVKPDLLVEFEKKDERSLQELCAGDEELHAALEHFLLINPEMILANLGQVPYWIAKGDASKSKGNMILATMDYETAARIACYENDKEATIRALTLAQATNPNPADAALHMTLLSKLDRVFEISTIHYEALTAAKKESYAAKEKLAPVLKSS